VSGAFGYLVWRSLYNRTAGQLRRLRSPRYLVALLVGLAYLWFVAVEQRPARNTVGASAAGHWVELFGALAVAGAMAWAWIFGVERRVLAFTPSEVSFLFPGPVSRRELIQFKLLRNQLLILLNALLWTLLLSRERFGASPWLRVLSFWALLTTLSFHRLGASFVRTSLVEHGRFGLKRRTVSLLLLAITLVALAWSVGDALPGIAAGGWESLPQAINEVASKPIPHVLLTPFRAMVRPLAAATSGEWLRAIGPALLLLALHYVWVVRSDTAFEEAAAEAALRRARVRSSGQPGKPAAPVAFRKLPAILDLAPVGGPEGAILWKNLVSVFRTRRLRSAAVALGVVAATVVTLSFDAEGTLAQIAGTFVGIWAGLMLVVGPQWVRNDLRSDLLKLDILRSYPVRGASVVAAEVAASTVVLSVIQLSLLALAYLAFLGNQSVEPDLTGRTLLLVAAVVHLPAINYMGMLIQNGAALLYPAWVHLGPGRPGGVEALGQNMLMIIAFLAVLGLALLVPAGAGGGLFLVLRPWLGWWSVLPGSLLGLGLLGLEARLGVERLGRVFEAIDPPTAGIPA
jgi:ABC-2 type transport system permease protein